MRRPSILLASGLASAMLVLTCGYAQSPATTDTAAGTSSGVPASEGEAEGEDAETDEDASRLSEGTGETAQASIGRFEELSKMSVNGKEYQFPIPITDLTGSGWELRDSSPLEANDLDGFWLNLESRDAYNAEKDSFVTLYLLNDTEQEMPVEQAELQGISVKIGNQGAGTDVSIVGGLTLGSSMGDLVEELGEPYDDGIARAENEGYSAETADVTWRYDDPETNTVEIVATINRETLEAEMLEVRRA